MMIDSEDYVNNDHIKFEWGCLDLMNLLFKAYGMHYEEACDMAITVLDTTTTTPRKSFNFSSWKSPIIEVEPKVDPIASLILLGCNSPKLSHPLFTSFNVPSLDLGIVQKYKINIGACTPWGKRKIILS